MTVEKARGRPPLIPRPEGDLLKKMQALWLDRNYHWTKAAELYERHHGIKATRGHLRNWLGRTRGVMKDLEQRCTE